MDRAVTALMFVALIAAGWFLEPIGQKMLALLASGGSVF